MLWLFTFILFSQNVYQKCWTKVTVYESPTLLKEQTYPTLFFQLTGRAQDTHLTNRDQPLDILLNDFSSGWWRYASPSDRFCKLSNIESKTYSSKGLRLSYGIYISQFIRFARVSSHVTDSNTRNKGLTAKLLQQVYRYHKLRNTFSKFYRRHYELVSKFNVGFKTLLHQGLSEPEFYDDLYKYKQVVGRAEFSDPFRKNIICYKRIGYNINIMRQSACLVVNPITVNNFASLFNCTPVGRASDSMMTPT